MKDKTFVAHILSLKRPLIITINLILRKPATSQIAIAVYELHSSPLHKPECSDVPYNFCSAANYVVRVNMSMFEH